MAPCPPAHTQLVAARRGTPVGGAASPLSAVGTAGFLATIEGGVRVVKEYLAVLSKNNYSKNIQKCRN